VVGGLLSTSRALVGGAYVGLGAFVVVGAFGAVVNGGYVGFGAFVVVGAGTRVVVVVIGGGPTVVVGMLGVVVLVVVVDVPGAGGSVDEVVVGSLESISLSVVLVSPPLVVLVASDELVPSDESGPVEDEPSITVVTAAVVPGAHGSVVCAACTPRPAAAIRGSAAISDRRVLDRRTRVTRTTPEPRAASPRASPYEPPVAGSAQTSTAPIIPNPPHAQHSYDTTLL
jgi:hypothetical protein